MVVSDAPDGRVARTRRTRAAIVGALLALIEEGEPQPPAARIAARAGVSTRLIYHHFADLEALFRAATEQQIRQVAGRVQRVPAEAPLARRIAAFVEQRANVLEAVTPVRRAAQLHEPYSPELRAELEYRYTLGRDEIERVFAEELCARPDGERDEVLSALDAAAGWEVWNRLRVTGYQPRRAAAVMHRMLSALLNVPVGGRSPAGGQRSPSAVPAT
jgi:AcrR family transcriptional regulator